MTKSMGKYFAPFRHLVLDLLLSRYCPDIIKSRKPVLATFRLRFYNTLLPSQSFKLSFNDPSCILNISLTICDISYVLLVSYFSTLSLCLTISISTLHALIYFLMTFIHIFGVPLPNFHLYIICPFS